MSIKRILTYLGVRPNKRLGQNFLVDEKVLQRLIKAADLGFEDIVLEVGAGLGTITRELLPLVKKVIAVEKDTRLASYLKESLGQFSNLEIIEDDALEVVGEGSFSKVLGAIPFQITSPLLHKILLSEKRPQAITFIVQKEVAQKITAQAPHASYLSNFVSLFGRAKIIAPTIKPSSFWPSPKVESVILRIEIKEKPLVDPQAFSKFLHRGFSHPRKMLKKVFAEKALQASGISSTSRAAELNPSEWLTLYLRRSTKDGP